MFFSSPLLALQTIENIQTKQKRIIMTEQLVASQPSLVESLATVLANATIDDKVTGLNSV